MWVCMPLPLSPKIGFGIKVTIVEPGGFSTDFFGNNSLALSSIVSDYDAIRKDFYEHAEDQDSGNPMATATAILSLVDSDNPPLRLLLGKNTFSWVKHIYSERLKTWGSTRLIEI